MHEVFRRIMTNKNKWYGEFLIASRKNFGFFLLRINVADKSDKAKSNTVDNISYK